MRDWLEEDFFTAAMYWRMAYGALRILLGLVLLRLVGNPLIDVIRHLMHHEIVEDPHEILYVFAQYVLGHHPVYITYFLASYFLFWGTIEVFLSYSMLKHRLWAFPVGLVLIGGFLLYEIFRYAHTYSPILLGVIVVDIAVIWLVRDEYKKLRSKQAPIPA